MTRAVRATAALLAAVVALVAFALPPTRLAGGPGDDSIPGVFHVHTNRSDGRSDPDEVAAAAARAGLRFVVFTDHGDGTRPPDPPIYRSGVLCIDAVEISTDAGHLIALGIPVSPFPLGGEGRDVLEDVHRLGGIGIAAHPDSPREDLQWRDWDAAIDGLELVNLDSIWRAHVAAGGWRTVARVIRDLTTYAVRPEETIASFVTGDAQLARRWTALAQQRRLAIFAGVDAHARLEILNGGADDNRWTLALPGYEAVFRTLTLHLRPAMPLTGQADRDGELVIKALREGHSYSSLDALLAPPAFEFSATVGGVTVSQGSEVPDAGPVSLVVRTNAPASFTTTVWRNDEALSVQPAAPELTVTAPAGPAVYRAEVRASGGAAAAWVLSNGIFVRSAVGRGASVVQVPAASRAVTATPVIRLLDRADAVAWASESAPDSKVGFDIASLDGRRELRARFGLPGGRVYGQYVALVAPVERGLAAARTLRFTIRSEQPMRVSAQLRVPAPGDGQPGDGQRWRRSVFVDDTPRSYEVALDDFRAVGQTPSAQAPLADVRAVMFVIDQVNTKPGTSGRVWLSAVSAQ